MPDYAGLTTTAYELGLEAARAQLRYHGWTESGGGWKSPPSSGSYTQPEGTGQVTIPDPASGPTGSIDISPGYGVMVDVWSEWYEPWVTRAEDTFKPWSDGKLPDPTYFARLGDDAFDCAKRLNLGGEDVGGRSVPTNQQLKWVGNTKDALQDMAGNTVKAFREQYVAGLEIVLPSLCGAAATIAEVLGTEAVVFHEAQRSIATIAEKGLETMRGAGTDTSSVSVDEALSVVGAAIAVGGALATGGFGGFVALVGASGSVVSAGKAFTFEGQTADEVFKTIDDAIEQLSKDIATEEEGAAAQAQQVADDMDLNESSYSLNAPRLLSANQEAGYADDGGEVLAVDAEKLVEIADDYLPKISSQFVLAENGMDEAYDSSGYTQWDRDSSIGRTPTGARTEWNVATYALRGHIHDVPNTLEDVADHLRIAAGFHGDNDAAVSQEMQAHTAEIS